jgi:hypothetical protein
VSWAFEEYIKIGEGLSAGDRNGACRVGFFSFGENEVCHKYGVK